MIKINSIYYQYPRLYSRLYCSAKFILGRAGSIVPTLSDEEDETGTVDMYVVIGTGANLVTSTPLQH